MVRETFSLAFNNYGLNVAKGSQRYLKPYWLIDTQRAYIILNNNKKTKL